MPMPVVTVGNCIVIGALAVRHGITPTRDVGLQRPGMNVRSSGRHGRAIRYDDPCGVVSHRAPEADQRSDQPIATLRALTRIPVVLGLSVGQDRR